MNKEITWSELRIKQDLLFSHLRNMFIKEENNVDFFVFDVDSWRVFKKNNKIVNYKGPMIKQAKYNENKDTIVILNPFYGWNVAEKFYIEVPNKIVNKLIGKKYLLTSFGIK